jgi:hypothetical protein
MVRFPRKRQRRAAGAGWGVNFAGSALVTQLLLKIAREQVGSNTNNSLFFPSKAGKSERSISGAHAFVSLLLGARNGDLTVLCEHTHRSRRALPTAARHLNSFDFILRLGALSAGLAAAASCPRPGLAAMEAQHRTLAAEGLHPAPRRHLRLASGASHETGQCHRRAHLWRIHLPQGQGTFEPSMPSSPPYRRTHCSQGATFCHHLL